LSFRADHTAATTEPASNFTAVIQWGDGTSSTVTSANGISGSVGSFVVQSSHTYAEEINTPTVVSVQILDVDGASTSSVSSSFTVADDALSGLKVNNPGATVGTNTGTFTVATFNDANTNAPASDFTATIGWGDGSTSTVSGSSIVSQGGGSFAVLASHTYSSAGNFTLSVAVADVGGASTSGSTGITVASVPAPTPPSPTSSSSSAGNVNMLLIDEIFLAYDLALYNSSGNPALLGSIAVLTGDVLSNPAFNTPTGFAITAGVVGFVYPYFQSQV
jgi:hypothetical protein